MMHPESQVIIAGTEIVLPVKEISSHGPIVFFLALLN